MQKSVGQICFLCSIVMINAQNNSLVYYNARLQRNCSKIRVCNKILIFAGLSNLSQAIYKNEQYILVGQSEADLSYCRFIISSNEVMTIIFSFDTFFPVAIILNYDKILQDRIWIYHFTV